MALLFYRKFELPYNDSKQTSISLEGVEGVGPKMGGAGRQVDPWGDSHTVFIVVRLSQVSDAHLKHVHSLSTNHISEKLLRSRYFHLLFQSPELTDSHAQRVGCTSAHSAPGRDPG